MSLSNEVRPALADYVACLRAICGSEHLPNDWSTPSSTNLFVTESEPNARRLPQTDVAIRGLRGTIVQLRTIDPGGPRGSLSNRLVDLVWMGVPKASADDVPALVQLRTRLVGAHETLILAFRNSDDFLSRAFDATGYKTYDGVEVARRANDEARRQTDLHHMVFLSELIREGLGRIGSLNEMATEFDNWQQLTSVLVEIVEEFAERSYHIYRACAFLNGPFCDFAKAVYLIQANEQSSMELTLSSASDELLSKCLTNLRYGERLPEGLQNVNTALSLTLRAPVLGTVQEFEGLYELAATVIERTVDVLRVASGGDIGVGYLTLVSDQFGAPVVRETYHTRFNYELAPRVARRGVFGMAEVRAISAEEINDLRELLESHLDEVPVRGFPIAIQRFRDSWERHRPDDPQRILDIAIALEAIFLNDSPTKELSFRLALRAARFLAEPGPERIRVYHQIKNIYEVRSAIAHGATIDSNDRKMGKKLVDALWDGPLLLRRTLHQLLRGHGPVGLRKESLKSWWTEVELG